MRAEPLSSLVHRACGIILAALALLTLPPARAQTEPVFRTTTEVVLVPVSVLDKHGHPVSGLKRDEFELRVNGKPAAITALDEISGPRNTPAAQPSLPPGTVTNVSPIETSQRSWVILLVDFVNTSLTDRMELRKQLLKFLSEDLRPGQQIAIYALSNSLVMLHPFTSDARLLKEAASRLVHEKGTPPVPANGGFVATAPAMVAGSIAVTPGSGASLATVNGRPGTQGDLPLGPGGDIEGFLLWGQWREAVYTTHTRAANTLIQFRQLANSFAGVAGKKTVLWLTSDASPLNPTLMYQVMLNDPASEPLRVEWREIAATYQALNSAGISVFPVDIRGIVNPGLAGAHESTSHGDFMGNLAQTQPGGSDAYPTTTARRQGEAGNAVLAMETAAVETGGQALRGSNDLSELFDRAQVVWTSYYVLAFTPEQDARAKSAVYRRIDVKVARRGLQVLFRRGYTTRPEAVIASENELRRDVSDAATSPVDLTAVPLTLKLEPADATPRPDVRFLLSIPGEALQRVDTPQGSHFNFSIFLLLKDARGKVISSMGDKIDRTFAPADAAGVTRNGFTYPGKFVAPAGEKSFARLIVRDNLSGHVGSITVQVARD